MVIDDVISNMVTMSYWSLNNQIVAPLLHYSYGHMYMQIALRVSEPRNLSANELKYLITFKIYEKGDRDLGDYWIVSKNYLLLQISATASPFTAA